MNYKTIVLLLFFSLPVNFSIPLRASPFEVELSSSGKVIVMHWHDRETNEKRHQELVGEYGMVVWYSTYEKNPKPFFQLFIQPEKRIFSTSKLKDFLNEISKIPSGAKIDLYEKCLTGTHYGMNESIMKRIEDHCKSLGIVFQKGPTICTCS